jgi:outer membrane protein OmpA-like peptidoglycan-associated protein
MKPTHVIAPVLAALLATACATNSQQASADRAAQAEADRDHARDEARKAELNTEKARADAQDAARAQYEANERAHFAAIAAAQAERDARAERGGGVTEPQPIDNGAYPGVAFGVGSADLTEYDRARLDETADLLRAYPSRKIIVEGYADNVTTDGQLSQRRADCVAHYLEKKGISGDRIMTRVGTRNAVRYSPTGDPNRRGLFRGVDIVVN